MLCVSLQTFPVMRTPTAAHQMAYVYPKPGCVMDMKTVRMDPMKPVVNN